VPVPEAKQPGRLGQTRLFGVSLHQPPRRVQVRGGQNLDSRLLAQVFQTGPGRVVDRRDIAGVRYRPGERARSAVDGAAVRGHLRRGFHAGAQLRAELFEDVHARRSAVGSDQRRGDQGRRTLVHHVHRPAVGYRPTVGPSGGHEVFRLQVSQVFRSHGARDVLQRSQVQDRVSRANETIIPICVFICQTIFQRLYGVCGAEHTPVRRRPVRRRMDVQLLFHGRGSKRY